MQTNFNQHFDLAVIGCGGIGSAVLYHAASRGIKAIGIEQFHIGHDRGSSHGQTRIIRQAYFEHPHYVPLLLEAYQLWRELELTSQSNLLVETGLLQVGPPDGVVVSGVRESARLHGLEVDHFDSPQLRARFPYFKIPEGHEGVFERKAGYLKVERCVEAHASEAVRKGAAISESTEVIEIRPNADAIRIETNRGSLIANRVILTVGAWLNRWLEFAAQPLQVLRKHLHWFKTDNPQWQARAGCPLFLFENSNGCFYGFPVIDKTGLKVSEHSGGEVITDPSQLSQSIDPIDLERVTWFLDQYFGGSFQHLDHKSCMYTMTRDHHFIVDHWPQDSRVLVAGGFSGHGFKFASVMGKLIADWAIDNQRDERLEFLRLDR
jgi:sarcosine oxidase